MPHSVTEVNNDGPVAPDQPASRVT